MRLVHPAGLRDGRGDVGRLPLPLLVHRQQPATRAATSNAATPVSSSRVRRRALAWCRVCSVTACCSA